MSRINQFYELNVHPIAASFRALVAILDADKEGFLRSETIGRAARNVDGRVILSADRITGSMERAIKVWGM